ncbi:MAG: class I SAM-dependent methyltransferase [Dehalococcoidia bacterium]|nr:class I SAM-dependent methyltransferase [Dehalococcoidia bacterium]MDD5494247.1 class I SAM-dependent methyltransferase [Dehalococcoidia bacterium]
MDWDNDYQGRTYRWGKGPSELALFAFRHIREWAPSRDTLSIIDIGCGYGRDAFYLARNIGCTILGIDSSQEAVTLAESDIPEGYAGKIRFRLQDFLSLPADNKYDIVFASMVLHALGPDDRAKLCGIIKSVLKPQGHVFLSTLSVSDPQHYGKGTPVAGETNSFVDQRYRHLFTSEELQRDFDFLSVKDLVEHEFDEHLAEGKVHHHILWLLAGALK